MAKFDDLTYEDKKKIADDFLFDLLGLGWDDLPDINSLHDAYDKDEVIQMCQERIDEDSLFEGMANIANED